VLFLKKLWLYRSTHFRNTYICVWYIYFSVGETRELPIGRNRYSIGITSSWLKNCILLINNIRAPFRHRLSTYYYICTKHLFVTNGLLCAQHFKYPKRKNTCCIMGPRIISPCYVKSGWIESDLLSNIDPDISSCPRWPITGHETSISMVDVHTVFYRFVLSGLAFRLHRTMLIYSRQSHLLDLSSKSSSWASSTPTTCCPWSTCSTSCKGSS
jgi:hypothetical protein